jgi:tetraacyldisaccharide 4'-kinase
LSLLSGLYGRAASLRRAWYERHPDRARRLRQPVVSVGNLVVGGSGKTPVVAALARLLSASGERPSILSRGYGRRRSTKEVVVVGDGREVLATPLASGDEPQMLARARLGVPVLVSQARYLAGEVAERRFGCTVHLLDDGFQHLQLARDLDLLVVTRADLDERVLPSGRLREPLGAATAADALLVAGSGEDAEMLSERLGVSTTFLVTRCYEQPRRVEPFGAALPPSIGRRVMAVAGIARPERFFATLRTEGWDVVGERTFPDHHWFTSNDLESIRRAARAAKADVVMTTEKDAARLVPPVGAGPEWVFLPLHAQVEPADAFAAWLADRIATARRRLGVVAA